MDHEGYGATNRRTRQARTWVGIDAGKGHRASILLPALDERIRDNDREMRETFRTDDRADVIESMPGMGPVLGAEFVAVDLSGYHDADRPASHAGPAPVARDSGRRSRDCHRSKRHNPRLRHIVHLAARTAMMRPGPSRDYYPRKRSGGLPHRQALLALARRRIDVLWAVLRDKRLFTSAPSVTQAA
ncbi:transposase [Streptomyces aurantiacus]|nr:transposase [Streptomyces aurantiacus]